MELSEKFFETQKQVNFMIPKVFYIPLEQKVKH